MQSINLIRSKLTQNKKGSLPGVQWQTPITKLISEEVRILERRERKWKKRNKTKLRDSDRTVVFVADHQTDEWGDHNFRENGQKGKGKLLEK